MPLVYQQNINEATKLAVWHIAEHENYFLKKVMLSNTITHPHKRLQHLAGRYLLTELFEDFPLELIKIADTKKPFLADEAFHFSISHCGDYAAVIASKSNRVGVDIEVISKKVESIRDKFLSKEEQEMIQEMLGSQSSVLKPQGSTVESVIHHANSNLHMLTLAWCVKETMFKWNGAGAIDFRKHLRIESISLHDNEFVAHCEIRKKDMVKLKLHGLIFNNNFLTWLVT